MNFIPSNILVKKFGGTSLANQGCIAHVASIIHSSYDKKQPVVVVVSAMSDATDHLKNLIDSHSTTASPHPERDVILSTGEQISAALLSMELEKRGVPARSWMGWQIPIVTTSHAECAHIQHIEQNAILDQIDKGIVPIVCGFQGIDENKRITTLGRGGSDTTAVALAAHLRASTCQIFTDVHGVYTADPSRIYGAKCYDTISYDDMLVLSRNGARILHPRCVAQAQKSNIPIHVLSTWGNEQGGTQVCAHAPPQKGITFKEATQWLLPHLCEKQIQNIHQKCQLYDIPILQYEMSPFGLSLVTWQEHAHMISPMVESDPKVMDVLTVIGLTQKEKNLFLSSHAHHIKKCLSYENYFMLISEKQNSLKLMNDIHALISTPW